ncbi:MAG: acyl-CoA thioesterase [Lautropia sp.]
MQRTNVKHRDAPASASAEPAPATPRGAYPALRPIQTRWIDNDVYGHVNNVVYFSYFDTLVNLLLIEGGALDIARGGVIGLVVDNACRYFAPVAFPDRLTGGVGVERLGNSSVVYRLGLFRDDEDAPVAQGRFVHVYVDRVTRRPVPLPDALRACLSPLVLPGG